MASLVSQTEPSLPAPSCPSSALHPVCQVSPPEPQLLIDPVEFDSVVKKLRGFFIGRGFLEVHTQNRLSILAACEDPETVQTYNYAGQIWPLPQTGQMWLEYELLKNPHVPGYFCVSTSYRNEPDPVPGRHDLIFPMFEFEMKGGFEAMIAMERELLEYLGYGPAPSFARVTYGDVALAYGSTELSHEHEARLCKDHGTAVFLTDFPEYTNPFWNMRRHTPPETGALKCDIIMDGQETIGSAERSCDPARMYYDFSTIEGGSYARLLFRHFGRERVENEMNEFLKHNFFPRSGGGIGLTRLIKSMKANSLI